MKIESLTEKQIERFKEFEEKWINIGSSTEPANRKEAEAGVNLAYELAGLKRPEKIVWCGSPMSMGLSCTIVFDLINQKDLKLRNSVWNSVENSVENSVGNSVRNSVGNSVRNSVGNSVENSVGNSGYGQHDAGWLSYYEYFREACGLENETQKLLGLFQISKNAGWWLPYEKICWISERHNILKRDNRGRLHCLDGPAVAYPDGWEIYALNGITISEDIIKIGIKNLPIERIEKEPNSEVRRVLIEQYGKDKFIQKSGAKLINKDRFGKLWRKEILNDEPLVMIEVLNSTPEIDGILNKRDALKTFDPNTAVCHDGMMIRLAEAPNCLNFKSYFIRVPANMQSAHKANAWTWGKKQEEYDPIFQS